MESQQRAKQQAANRIVWIAVWGTLCLVPFLVVYFANLSRYPHYEFFPVLLIALGSLVWTRASGQVYCTRMRLALARLGLVFAILNALAAVAFLSPWMAYFAVLVFATSAFFLLDDKVTERSLAPLALLLVVLWQPPYTSRTTADVVVTSAMQRKSTACVSAVLDVFGTPHLNQGTVISIRGMEMGVEEACSGIQSLFLYFGIAALCAVYFRRSWPHSLILLGSALLWALVTNSVRILIIAWGHLAFDIDLSHGFLHGLLGYCLMIVGIGLIASFDQLLLLLPLPVHKLKNASLSTVPLQMPNWRNIRLREWAIIGLMGLLLTGQILDVGAATVARKEIDFFAGDSIVPAAKTWLPESVAGWTRSDYRREERSTASDLGQRSDIWTFERDGKLIIVSFDQVFPGWHELTKCYEGRGWQCKTRNTISLHSKGGDSTAILGVRAGLAKDQPGLLLFTMLRRDGTAIAAPEDWRLISSLFHRVKNRLSPRIRAGMFGAEAYQFQVFTQSASETELQDLMEVLLPQIQAMLGLIENE